MVISERQRNALWQTLVGFVAYVRAPEQREATSSLLADEGLDRVMDVLGLEVE